MWGPSTILAISSGVALWYILVCIAIRIPYFKDLSLQPSCNMHSSAAFLCYGCMFGLKAEVRSKTLLSLRRLQTQLPVAFASYAP